ncbi:hypothetical protein ACS43A_24155, partial [Salmonella enterica]
MSQLKQPIFLKKIKKVINTIPGLEEQIFACRNKKRSDNPLLFIDRKDEERILGNDSNLLIVFYVQIMPDDFVMQLHR